MKAMVTILSYCFCLITVFGLFIPTANTIGVIEHESPVRYKKSEWLLQIFAPLLNLALYIALALQVFTLTTAISYLCGILAITFAVIAVLGFVIVIPSYKIMFFTYSIIWALPPFIVYSMINWF